MSNATRTLARSEPPPYVPDESAIRAVLSPVALEIVDAIGLQATIALVERFGGCRLIIPARITDGCPLAIKVGPELAERLVAGLGGQISRPIDLPMLASIKRLLRDNSIRAEFDAGATEDDLARAYGVTTRCVRGILKAATTTAPRQRQRPVRDRRTYDLFTALHGGPSA